MEWEQNCKLLVLLFLCKLTMVQQLQLHQGSLYHCSRHCWTLSNARSRTVAWNYLLVRFLHRITNLPHFQGGQESIRCFMAGDTEFSLLFVVSVVLIVPWGSWEETLRPATFLLSVCDPSWWLGSTGVLGGASAITGITCQQLACLPTWLFKSPPHCSPGLSSPFWDLH